MDRQARQALLKAGKSQNYNELSSAWAVQNMVCKGRLWKKFVPVEALGSTISLWPWEVIPAAPMQLFDKLLLPNNLQLDLAFLRNALVAE
jgi:hypothetical protein